LQGAVLCVRFSNIDGSLLASGSDDKTIIIWKQQAGHGFSTFGEEENVETWKPLHVLNKHNSGILWIIN
jgi:WD40 repeat protein